MLLDLFRKEVGFENIQGYDDIKDIVKRALDTEDNYNLLFIGPPASAKTLFLLGIIEYKNGEKLSISTTCINDFMSEYSCQFERLATLVYRGPCYHYRFRNN